MEYPENLKIPPFTISILKLTLPFGILAIHLVLLYFFLDPTALLVTIGLMVAYVLPPAGKETVIPAGIALGIPWWLIAVSIMMIDIETALFMGWNFDLLLKIPMLGKTLESFIRKTRDFIREQPWLKKIYFAGIVVLVMVPVLGSGGIRGSIIGQLLGMQKTAVFLAIVIGAFVGCFGIALGALFLQELFLQSILWGITAVAGLIILAILGWLYWKRSDDKASSGKKGFMKVFIFSSLPEQYLQVQSPLSPRAVIFLPGGLSVLRYLSG